MCGIAGGVNLNCTEEQLQRMNQVLSHRGPDASGIHYEHPTVLLHTRLSIIDLVTGDQPLSNEDNTIWVVFNGEVYNYLDLRTTLEAQGHQFKTKSDTEVIVHLYEQYGCDCVQHLRGMFAFALWDQNRQRLFLARDRLGQKPLYYTQLDDGFTFGSELKAILENPAVSRQLDLVALDYYFALGYVPAPITIYEGIYKLPPAHWLLFEANTIRTEQYWAPDFSQKAKFSSEQEAIERLDTLLSEAVSIRLMSEVPLGAFLSGGIDSSLVIGYMARHLAEPVKTFSIGFTEEKFNELPYARQIATLFGTDHQEFIVQPEAAEVIGDLVWFCDEPFADASALPTYYVSKMARQHVTVALNGDGGDDSFGGYAHYLRAKVLERYRQVPLFLRRNIAQPILRLASKTGLDSRLHTLYNYNTQSFNSFPASYLQFPILWPQQIRQQLFSKDVFISLNGASPEAALAAYFEVDPPLDFVDSMLQCDLHNFLPGDLLVKMDRMSMAHSLEARSPFLDHKVVEFAAQLPSNLKLRGRRLKYILRELGKKYLPSNIIERPKRGFSVPLHTWFRNELRSMGEELLINNSQLVQDGILKAQPIQLIWNAHQHHNQTHGHQLWSLLILEQWYRGIFKEFK